jgi:hypothetical protein
MGELTIIYRDLGYSSELIEHPVRLLNRLSSEAMVSSTIGSANTNKTRLGDRLIKSNSSFLRRQESRNSDKLDPCLREHDGLSGISLG